jgi:putative ABC transport system permease protein
MIQLRAWLRRLAGLGNLYRGARRDSEFTEELESHLQMHIDDNMRSGMTYEEARRQALIRLGGIEQTREIYRDRLSVPWLETALKDMRFALRLMARSPGFTAVILVTLAIGIGANTAMFSVVNTLLIRPLPYRDSSRLLFIETVDASRRQAGRTAPPDFYEYRAGNRTLEHLDAFYTQSLNLTGGSDPERVSALIVSPGFFTTLGTPPALGRGFVAADEQWGAHRVAILGDGLWRRRFGADPAVVGQRITVNGEPFVVAGVLPPKFMFLGLDSQLFLPMAFAPGDNLNSHSNNFLRMIGRLKPGVTREQASADLNRLSEAIIATRHVNVGTALELSPLRDALVRDVRQAVLVLLGAVGFVLLISCANLANLLLARGGMRRREVAVRLAMGATRGRLLRQFLTESVLLAIAGGVAGLGLAFVSVDALNALSQRVLPRSEDIHIDPTVMAFTFAVALMTGVLFGLAPALQGVAAGITEDLKDGTRASDGRSRHRLRASLIVAEVALSLVLLAGAGLMVKSVYRLLHVDAGFDTEGVVTMFINLPREKYVDLELDRRQSPRAYDRATRFFDDVIGRTRAVPGVRAAGAVNGLPLLGEIWGKNITFYDRPLPPDFASLPPIQYRVVAGDYFHALGIQIRSGRAFTDRDTRDAPKVAIVNRELVRRYWDDRDPIGKVISVNPPLEVLPKSLIDEAIRSGNISPDYKPDRYTVVGVVDDVHYGGLSQSPVPLVYTPYAQGSEGTTAMFLTVRADGDPMSVVGAIREQIRQVDRDQPVASIQTMEARVAASVSQPRVQMNVLGAFAGLAILLAAIGIYGVMSYAVTQRTREIGIRMALGAGRREVLRLVLRQGFTMVIAGLAAGLLGAMLLTRVLRTLLFGVSTTDPAVFATIVGLLSVTAWLAAYLPARRATRVDPLVALRNE